MKRIQLILITALFSAQALAYELPKQTVKDYDCESCNLLSHERLADNWKINHQPLIPETTNTQKSFGYKKRVNLEQLQKGVLIPILAPGAVVRITPLEDKLIPEFILQTPDNQEVTLKEASKLYSQDELLGDALLSTKHQTMIQIKPELGYGSFILKSKHTSLNHAKNYLINVYDKYSSTYLELQSKALHYQFGDQFVAQITLKDKDAGFDIGEIDAYLIGPKDQIVPLQITKIKKDQYEVSTVLKSEENDHGENWYLEASTVSEHDDQIILRSAHLAFSYSIPSASILTIKKIASHPLTFAATLDIATASRYSIQSVLFHKNKQGNIYPLELSQLGVWLEPGIQSLEFSFDKSGQLAEDELYLGYFRLLDYGQLKPVYQFNRAIEVSKLTE